MDSKMLSIQSFERNQVLLSFINKVIADLQLRKLGAESLYTKGDIDQAVKFLINFLTRLQDAVQPVHGKTILTGADMRERSFIRKFIDAKHKSRQYKSILFKKAPADVVRLLTKQENNDTALVEALTDLRNLITEHIALDLRDLVGDL